jgi:tRNA 2-thiouridine synthesizing protein E
MADILGAEVDEEGFLVDLKDWTKEIAVEMAKGDDIELSEEHWDVINFLRDYFEEYQIAPAVRVLTKAIGSNI